MGAMTDSMKRLRGEVDALRMERGAMTMQRRDAVATMQAGFRKTHGEMAEKAKNERVAFVTDLAAGAMKMLGGFHKSRSAMAMRTRAERLTFVLEQKRTVASLRQAFAAEMAGAHRAWCGPFAAEMPMRGPSADAGRQPIQAEHKAVENAPVHPRPASEARETAKEERMKPQSGHPKTKGSAAKGKKM